MVLPLNYSLFCSMESGEEICQEFSIDRCVSAGGIKETLGLAEIEIGIEMVGSQWLSLRVISS